MLESMLSVMTGKSAGSDGGASGFDPRAFPSCVGIDILLSDQIGEYSTKDLQKIAMDIKAGVPHADEAFHYVYSRMMGWA